MNTRALLAGGSILHTISTYNFAGPCSARGASTSWFGLISKNAPLLTNAARFVGLGNYRLAATWMNGRQFVEVTPPQPLDRSPHGIEPDEQSGSFSHLRKSQSCR
jgi:hypothetical protein